ncbi:MAG: alpha/beta fold hydrolase [Halioglobus sp.]
MGHDKNSMSGVRVSAIAIVAIASFFASLFAGAENLPSVDHSKITIWSQGVRLAGDIYRPSDMAEDAKLPGVLLVPGWGGSKDNVGKNYAPHFAEAGFIVLTFDFKSWGESDGPLLASAKLEPSEEAVESTVRASQIRNIVNPFSMSADVRAALHYLGGEPNVMPDNLGIWGTSMGGALALVSATSDDRIKAYVDQMGPVNQPYNLKELPAASMRQAETRVARGEIPPYPGPESKGDPRLRGYPDWVALKRFEPLADIDQLKAATLIIDAEGETLFDPAMNGGLLYEAIKDRLPSRYVTYPGGHYEMYKGDNLSGARQDALAWFIQYLK